MYNIRLSNELNQDLVILTARYIYSHQYGKNEPFALPSTSDFTWECVTVSTKISLHEKHPNYFSDI